MLMLSPGFCGRGGKTSKVGIYHQGLRGSCSKGTPLFVARGSEINLWKEFCKVWALEELQHAIYLPETSCRWFIASFNGLGDVSQNFFSHPVFSPLWKVHMYTTALWERERERKQWSICVKWDCSVGKAYCSLQTQTCPQGRSQGIQAF